MRFLLQGFVFCLIGTGLASGARRGTCVCRGSESLFQGVGCLFRAATRFKVQSLGFRV